MAKRSYLSEADRDRVSKAVSEAESRTAGEIVTIIADRSDGYTDVALSWAILAAFLEMAAFSIAPELHLDAYDPLRGDWAGEWTASGMFTLVAAASAMVFVIVLLLQLWQPLKFFLIPPPIKTHRVHERAIRAFRMAAERRTHGRTGILIYLSMRERRAEIVADEAIASRVEPKVWGDAMEAILGELKQGRIADGMVAGVAKVGAVLAEHLPIEAGDTNELPDRLIEV
jgi:putative membrane protein